MKKTIHSLLWGLCGLLLVSGVPNSLHAQDCRSESQEVPWPVPPALAGQDGNEEGGAGTVFIGERNTGNIQKWSLSLGSLQQVTTLMPGIQLPGEVTGIWSLAVPKEDLVVALVTYNDAGVERYGILRSENLGETWELVKPDAFKNPQLVSLEGTSGGQFNDVDFTGNYWRAALLEMTWLNDGDHGWVWGRKGILRTTDAGKTWSLGYLTDNQNNRLVRDNDAFWAVAFKNADSGVAVKGSQVNMEYFTTADGGVTWTKTKSLNTLRVGDFVYTGGEYRMLQFNRFNTSGNSSSTYSPNNGVSWLGRGNVSSIPSEGVFMVEWLWPNPQDGFLIYRQGEIWRTTDGGDRWERMQTIDDSYPAIEYGDGTAINGDNKPPFYPYAGYGQTSILVRDDFGDAYIVQALTTDCTGEVEGYVPAWLVGTVTSVPVEAKSLAGFSAFPNPTSDRCDVRFSLESTEAVRATLVDSRGNIVRDLNFGQLTAGRHVRNLDLGDLPNGSYRLVVRAGEKRSVEGIILER